MTIKAGDKMPAGVLTTPGPEGPQKISTDQLFAGKKVVLVAVPGAFTPTCDARHLPGFIQHAEDFKAKGVDTVASLSVNDAFVMYQWGKSLGLEKVKLLPDGSGHFTRRMGMLIDKDHLGFGYRSWRYAMIVEDNQITHWFEEPGINDAGTDSDPYGETAPEKLLGVLTSDPVAQQA